jgi:hypothetical protein
VRTQVYVPVNFHSPRAKTKIGEVERETRRNRVFYQNMRESIVTDTQSGWKIRDEQRERERERERQREE